MKQKNIFRLATLFVATCIGTAAMAQETTLQTSTAEAPIWYNMNCAGTSGGVINAAIAQYTSVTLGEIAKGDKPVSPVVVLPTQNQDKYLWRFESDGAGNVKIVNKLSATQITNPATATSNSRYTLSSTGSTFVPTAVASITSSNVTGTAFYFMPTDAAYATVGRLNCEGTTAELALYRPAASGTGDIGSGGKGSLFWLRLVPMKKVTATVATTGTGAGMTTIMKDDAQTPEEVQTVSKAQSLGVTLIASANSGSQFVAWKNKVTGATVSTAATFIYSGTADIELEAVFDLSTGIKQLEKSTLGFYPNPAAGNVNCSSEVTKTVLYNHAGQVVLKSTGNTFSVKNVPAGSYILRLFSEKGSEDQILLRK